MVEIYAVKVPNDINNYLFNSVQALVDEERKVKTSKFVYKEDAYKTIIGDILIRSTACEKLEMNNKQYKIDPCYKLAVCSKAN